MLGRFLPAAELSARFYAESVRPLLGNRPHAAALLGWGSDVLGYDTPRSTTTVGGPRVLVLLDDAGQVADVSSGLDRRLPELFVGWPVRFGWDATPVTHHVTCQWHRLAQEEAFVRADGRTGRRDRLRGRRGAPGPGHDAAGAAAAAAYAPYSKWLGTAFARSRHDDDLPRHLSDVVSATDAGPREDALAAACLALARRHDASGFPGRCRPRSARTPVDRPRS